FGRVFFPGNLAQCETCHVPGAYDLPFPAGVQPTVVTQAGRVISSISPVRSVCTSCHDAAPAGGHIDLMTTDEGLETCEVCHGAGRDFDVVKVHGEN
ncbi:MAG TPA: cytochrome c3 family protein, partial [Anaerolineales bacterium]